jgi:hypothetical protein
VEAEVSSGDGGALGRLVGIGFRLLELVIAVFSKR